MASSLFSSLTSGLGGLLGFSDSTQSWMNAAGSLGDFALGAYDTYQGLNQDAAANNYLNSLGASYAKSDELLQAQADRAKEIYYPIEDLQAQYTLEDLQRYRPLQVNQQQYGIDRGNEQIAFAQNTMDPMQDALLTQLSQGADAQKYRDIASADVQQSYDQASADTQRAYARMGINPNSGAFTSMLKQGELAKAAAEAGARTNASRMAEDLDLSRKQQAMNAWNGIPFQLTSTATSGSALANQAASGLSNMASGLTSAAKLANSMADNSFASATYNFGNIGSYLGSSGANKPNTLNNYSSGYFNPGY